ncbi:MAG: ribonuclease [Acidobacteria bacterium]|nr:MAG: ribonuclease [Acidobacteriota bacterium]
MTRAKMLINAKDFDQIRVATINEQGLLEQIDFESLDENNCLGNIYKATITAIEPSLQATFVDYGCNRHGFLPFNEIHYSYHDEKKANEPVVEKLKVGQEILVQVAREEIGLKGAYLTTLISIPGRYLVLMPYSKKSGISRKIKDVSDRQSLRKVLNQVSSPENMGYIIRTAGLGKTKEQIQRDLNVLLSTWNEIITRFESSKSPTLLYLEDNLVNRTIRDYFNEETREILVDDKRAYEEISRYFKKVMPRYAHMVKHYRGKTPIFSKYKLEEQVEKIFTSKIKLPSGGSIVIEQTEALVVIDVNSGKTSEGNLELTALKTNLEAAEEAARQLRLRDLGGLIVIDFIDLRDRKNVYEVEKKFREQIKTDKARTAVTPLSRFGILEMSRQRINTSKDIKHYVDCQVCGGSGRVKTMQTQALDLLRRVKTAAANHRVRRVQVTCSDDLGIHMLNDRRHELMDLEKKHGCQIFIQTKVDHRQDPIIKVEKGTLEEKEKMEIPPPLSLSSVTASMSEEAINEARDYKEEKLKNIEEMTFENLRGQDIPAPKGLSPFDRFNFSIRVILMKKHGLYENRTEEFKSALREKVVGISNDEEDGELLDDDINLETDIDEGIENTEGDLVSSEAESIALEEESVEGDYDALDEEFIDDDLVDPQDEDMDPDEDIDGLEDDATPQDEELVKPHE